MHAQRLLDILVATASSRVDKALSLSPCEGQTVGGIEHLLWDTAVKVYGADLPAILGDLLNAYSRSPGMDAVARLTPSCIGTQGYEALLTSLKASTRRDVRFFDHGWHIELRSRLCQYLCRGLQRRLVEENVAPESLIEDLLGHDLGM